MEWWMGPLKIPTEQLKILTGQLKIPTEQLKIPTEQLKILTVTIPGLDAATPGTREDETINMVSLDATQEADDKDTGTNGGAKGIVSTMEVIDLAAYAAYSIVASSSKIFAILSALSSTFTVQLW